jgi:hypothetical protein
MSYFFPAKTNHRRVRSHLMKVAMRKLAHGSITGRRAVEGVTYILKGATYLPAFNAIDLSDAVAMGKLSAKDAAHHSGTARGLRKGALWAAALNRAGIPVTLDYFDPTQVQLPDLMDVLVDACTEALVSNLTDKDIVVIAQQFGLPIEQVGPQGWTDVHDVLMANAILAKDAGDDDAAQNIAAFAFAHANGEMPDTHIDLVDAANAAAQLAEGQAPAPLQIEEQPEVEDIGTLIAQLEGLKAKVLAHGQVAG